MSVIMNNQNIIIHKCTNKKDSKNDLSHLNDEFWRKVKSKDNKIISFEYNKQKDLT